VAFLLPANQVRDRLVSASPFMVARQQAVRAFLWQAGMTLVLGMAAGLAVNARAGIAVVVGGGISMLGSAYLGIALFKQRPGGHPGRFVWDVFLSWAVKLGLVISLLAIAFRSRQLPPPWLMAGLCGALLAYWLAMSTARTGPVTLANRGSERDGE
jgi:F0F1-type ATP synthase assembly protein I